MLSTGELVACVCIGCYQQLPAGYIEDQAQQAHRKAYCSHTEVVEVTSFGKANRQYTCTGCGGWVSDDTWPTFHLG